MSDEKRTLEQELVHQCRNKDRRFRIRWLDPRSELAQSIDFPETLVVLLSDNASGETFQKLIQVVPGVDLATEIREIGLRLDQTVEESRMSPEFRAGINS